ncbi:MAG: transcription-repair coupling factor [Bacilli bacterium]|nr:transcription-repair coupling factor [Bacilli bacterium]
MSFFSNIKFDFGKDEIVGLNEEAKALFVYNYFKKIKTNLVIVFSTTYEANNFYQIMLNYTEDVLFFPMDDFLTSEALAVSPEFKSIRIETLDYLVKKRSIVITDLMGYLRFLPSKKVFEDAYINLKVKDKVNLTFIVEKLIDIGYSRTSFVNKTGDIAVRGFVIDLFSPNSDKPIRIELWGDVIESIRCFDLETQHSSKKIDSVSICPNSEFIVEKFDNVNEKKQKFLPNYTEGSNISNFDLSEVIFNNYHDLKLSYERLVDEVFEYNNSLSIKEEINYMFDFYKIKNNAEKYFELFSYSSNKVNSVYYDDKKVDLGNINSIAFLSNIKKLQERYTIIICLNSKEKIRKVMDVITDAVITDENKIFEGKINVILRKITKGFYFEKYLIISENDLFTGSNDSNYKNKTKFKIGTRIKDISKLNVGDFVVHSLYGIGKYLGIKTIEKKGLKKDYLFIEYRGDDRLYIPVEKIDQVYKYSQKEGNIPVLNRLNSKEWAKTKAKAKEKVESIAGDLLRLYALREKAKGFAFDRDNNIQKEFENDFMYQETIDQIKVISEIKKDMESSRPMDRLLCGDVGYGKTEVAFRAAFKAILSSKQVAILCPTTILSHQHYQNAIERFKNFPVRIAILNRFISLKKQKQIIEDLKVGKIDLLIGTHKILGKEVVFKDLGLLIIDEEQRFGVKHKEKIKEYKNEIDVLTLSATPIPRTLQMSLAGVRNLSLIETPPVNRYPIQTYVLPENKQVMRDAIYKELSRKGQIFILYNHISEMSTKKREIEALVPEAKIVTANGQMGKNELEDVMNKFVEKKYDILISTTIIETGIDIPNVNTLIILDSDYFGLSQLYQIRGRVGRSTKIAYCYLMYNQKKILNELAVKRLSAIKEFTELGSGFSIAMRDLSIRGAGDILGSEQAGFIDSVGIELFMDMLEDEINRLKGISTPEEKDDLPLIDVSTFIDDKFASEEEVKIEIHKKINEIDSLNKLFIVKEELEDRFGKLDEDVIIYMYEEIFEKKANKLGIERVIQNDKTIEILIPEKLVKNIKVTDLFINTTNITRNFRFKMLGKNLLITLNLYGLEKHFIYYLVDFINLLS